MSIRKRIAHWYGNRSTYVRALLLAVTAALLLFGCLLAVFLVGGTQTTTTTTTTIPGVNSRMPKTSVSCCQVVREHTTKVIRTPVPGGTQVVVVPQRTIIREKPEPAHHSRPAPRPTAHPSATHAPSPKPSPSPTCRVRIGKICAASLLP